MSASLWPPKKALPRAPYSAAIAVLVCVIAAPLVPVRAVETDGRAAPPQLGSLAATSTGLFLENKGQVAEPVAFYLPGARGTVFMTPSEIVFSIGQSMAADDEEARPGRSMRRAVVRQAFLEASSKVALEGLDRAAAKTQVIRGAAGGAANFEDIGNFQGVLYRGLYPKTDLECRVSTSGIERTLVLHGNATLDGITIRYEGAEGMRVTDDGGLDLSTPLGVIHEAPLRVRFADRADAPETTARYRVTAPSMVTLELKND